jgi:hypothetical protein
MKISINEPCHENWDDMTPNQQGAFCKSCAKDVVDFSKMGITQIKSFFSKPEDSGKVCGRFKETQLQELSFDDFFSKFTYWNFTKKFAAIFFMAFGFWIFSNSTALAQEKDPPMMGKVSYTPDKNPKADTAKSKSPKSSKNPEHSQKMGIVACEKPVQTSKNESKVLMGDVYINHEDRQPIAPKKEK